MVLLRLGYNSKCESGFWLRQIQLNSIQFNYFFAMYTDTRNLIWYSPNVPTDSASMVVVKIKAQ